MFSMRFNGRMNYRTVAGTLASSTMSNPRESINDSK